MRYAATKSVSQKINEIFMGKCYHSWIKWILCTYPNNADIQKTKLILRILFFYFFIINLPCSKNFTPNRKLLLCFYIKYEYFDLVFNKINLTFLFYTIDETRSISGHEMDF